jgi:hypothetical protein
LASCGWEEVLLTIVELGEEVGGARVNDYIRPEDVVAGDGIVALGRHRGCRSDGGEGDENFRQVEEHFESEMWSYSTVVGYLPERSCYAFIPFLLAYEPHRGGLMGMSRL